MTRMGRTSTGALPRGADLRYQDRCRAGPVRDARRRRRRRMDPRSAPLPRPREADADVHHGLGLFQFLPAAHHLGREPDRGNPVVSAADASRPDTSVPDTSVPDTSVPDTSALDTSVSDTSTPDVSPADGAFPTTANLLLNGDAESGAGSPTAQVVLVPPPSIPRK